MLTTTGTELGAERPADPLVYFCENEVVDSRSLAAEITRALALDQSRKEGAVFWGPAPPWPICGGARRCWRARRCRC